MNKTASKIMLFVSATMATIKHSIFGGVAAVKNKTTTNYSGPSNGRNPRQKKVRKQNMLHVSKRVKARHKRAA